MEQAAIILLYIGTILIGSEYISKMCYLLTIFVLPLTKGIKPLAGRLMRPQEKSSKFRAVTEKTGLTILLILWVLLLVTATIAFLPFLVIGIGIGQPLMWINIGLNKLLLRLMGPWKDIYFARVCGGIKGRRTRIKPTDQNLWRIAQENRAPFLALFGVVCVTAGFILKLAK